MLGLKHKNKWLNDMKNKETSGLPSSDDRGWIKGVSIELRLVSSFGWEKPKWSGRGASWRYYYFYIFLTRWFQ